MEDASHVDEPTGCMFRVTEGGGIKVSLIHWKVLFVLQDVLTQKTALLLHSPASIHGNKFFPEFITKIWSLF